MHPALLIDEIFQVILDGCSDWHKPDYHWTLCQLARTCKAWQDPALDRLWMNVSNAGVLAQLHEMCKRRTTSVSQRGRSYAARIRQLSLGGLAPARLAPLSGLTCPVLPNLTTAKLTGFDGCFLSKWIAVQTLREMDINTGHMLAPGHCHLLTVQIADSIHKLSAMAQTAGPGLQKLSVRGRVSATLSPAIMTLRSLRVLSLRTGNAITASALAAVSSFPFLQEFSIHADHIGADQFVAALSAAASTQIFPSLRSLDLRGQQSLIRAVVERLPQGNLQSLRLVATRHYLDASAWTPIFEQLPSKAGRTLLELTVEHIIDIDDIDDTTFLLTGTDTRFTIDTISPLAGLRALRQFILETTIPPTFNDKEMEQIASWWPMLQHLDIGLTPYLDEFRYTWIPRATIATLSAVARQCSHLETLICPMDIAAPLELTEDVSSRPRVPAVPQRSLRKLHVGHNTIPGSECVFTFVKHVLEVFPAVAELECVSVDASVSKTEVPLLKLREEMAQAAATEDGIADGQ